MPLGHYCQRYRSPSAQPECNARPEDSRLERDFSRHRSGGSGDKIRGEGEYSSLRGKERDYLWRGKDSLRLGADNFFTGRREFAFLERES